RDLPFEGMTNAQRPRWRAVSRPGASARFEITTAMRASGILPAAMLSAMATKLEPRPERRMPRFFIRHHYSPRRHRETEKIESSCHPECSEGPAFCGEVQIPRFATDDNS